MCSELLTSFLCQNWPESIHGWPRGRGDVILLLSVFPSQVYSTVVRILVPSVWPVSAQICTVESWDSRREPTLPSLKEASMDCIRKRKIPLFYFVCFISQISLFFFFLQVWEEIILDFLLWIIIIINWHCCFFLVNIIGILYHDHEDFLLLLFYVEGTQHHMQCIYMDTHKSLTTPYQTT